LQASPADQAVHLTWQVFANLPPTTTWTITYEGPAGDQPSPIQGLPEPARAYSLTGLTNYEWYTITMNTEPALLMNTVRIMPTDLFIYLPTIRNQH